MFFNGKDSSFKPNRYHIVQKEKTFEIKALRVEIATPHTTYRFTIKQKMKSCAGTVSLYDGETSWYHGNPPIGEELAMYEHIYVSFPYSNHLNVAAGDDSARYSPDQHFSEFTMDDGVSYTIPSSDIVEIKQELFVHEVVTKMVDVVEKIK